MRVPTSRLIEKRELTDEDLSYHKFNRFYDPNFITKPEFIFKNHLIKFKESDEKLLSDVICQADEEEKRLEASSKQAAAPTGKQQQKGKDLKGGKN